MVRITKQEVSKEEDFAARVAAYLRIKQSIAELTKEAKSMGDQLKDELDEVGEEDEGGSRWIRFEEPVEGAVAIKRERRVKRTLDEDAAETILRGRGLYERCYDVLPVLNEDEVMACLAEELLTDEDLDAMFPTAVSWALVAPKK